jgi:hypothetical protein
MRLDWVTSAVPESRTFYGKHFRLLPHSSLPTVPALLVAGTLYRKFIAQLFNITTVAGLKSWSLVLGFHLVVENATPAQNITYRSRS